MMAKTCFAGVMALALATGAKAEALYTHPHVKQVICTTPKGQGRGTAWRVSKGRFASVSHVTRIGNCTINGKPVTVEYDDPWGDFSIIRVEDDVDGGIPVNCGGFRHGSFYYSVGYARGLAWSIVITLRADNLMPGQQRFRWQLFSGLEHVIPGMSGGPLLNRAGEAVGSVNAYNPGYGISWSRPLSATPLCQG